MGTILTKCGGKVDNCQQNIHNCGENVDGCQQNPHKSSTPTPTNSLSRNTLGAPIALIGRPRQAEINGQNEINIASSNTTPFQNGLKQKVWSREKKCLKLNS